MPAHQMSLQRKRTSVAVTEGIAAHASVCRNCAHSAISLGRCIRIPARYCAGYLHDIGRPLTAYPMDFSSWFEAFPGAQWYASDSRPHVPRIGCVLIAHSRDAADTALTTTLGVHHLVSCTVWTDVISEAGLRPPRSAPQDSVIEC
jgi:transglutaminase-like putative cysteine protease